MDLAVDGWFPPLDVVGHAVDLGWLGHVLAVFYLVWVLNLYNFMDGIDGIASVEAIGVCVGGALIYWLTGHVAMVGIPLLLACAVAGFLIWNFLQLESSWVMRGVVFLVWLLVH